MDPIKPGDGAAAPTAVAETPEFKEALKREREQLERNIRESNQQHLAKREAEIRAELEAGNGRPHTPAPNATPDFFVGWGERYGLPADAGRELAVGIMEHVQGKVLPEAITPITQREKAREIRDQRRELRAAKPKLAQLDDKYGAEALKMVEALRPDLVGPESYAKALHMVIGGHIEELMTPEPAPENAPEIVPGPEPSGSAPSPKKKVSLNTEQKQFIDERGMSEDDFVEMMRGRASALEGKGFTKAQVRQRLGNTLGTIEF